MTSDRPRDKERQPDVLTVDGLLQKRQLVIHPMRPYNSPNVQTSTSTSTYKHRLLILRNSAVTVLPKIERPTCEILQILHIYTISAKAC